MTQPSEVPPAPRPPLPPAPAAGAPVAAPPQVPVPERRTAWAEGVRRLRAGTGTEPGRLRVIGGGTTAEKLLEREEFAEQEIRQIKVGNRLDCPVRLQLGQADAVLTDNALGAGQAAQDRRTREAAR